MAQTWSLTLAMQLTNRVKQSKMRTQIRPIRSQTVAKHGCKCFTLCGMAGCPGSKAVKRLLLLLLVWRSAVSFETDVTLVWYGHPVSSEGLLSVSVSVLDSDAEVPGFKSQPQCCRVTVLGKLFTPIVPMFTKQRNWYQPS